MFYAAKVLQKSELCNTKYLFMVVFMHFAKCGLHFWYVGELGEIDILGDLEDLGILNALGDLYRIGISGRLYIKKRENCRWKQFSLMCAGWDSNSHEIWVGIPFFSLTINQLVSNFKYHFMLGRFGQILGHFLSIQIDCKGTKNN